MCISPKVNVSVKQPAKKKVFGATDTNYQSILKSSNFNVERLQKQRLKAFEEGEPEYRVVIEMCRLGYSEHLFEFKLALKNLAEGETLKITSRSKTLIGELAAACRILDLAYETRRFRKLYFLYATCKTAASTYPLRSHSTNKVDPDFGRTA